VGDVSQQEPRLCAHFAGGAAAQAYRDDPHLDDHMGTARLMAIGRPQAKTLNLASYYALGLEELARRLGVSTSEAAAMRHAWKRARPDVAALDMELRRAWARGEPIETWGGAVVYCEPPQGDRTWEYRALNTRIQRSAAEQIKEVMIAWEGIGRDLEAPMIFTIHDEAAVENETRRAPETRRLLQEVLEGVGEIAGRPFSVPFVAEVGVGTTWRRAKK
jgi:DNA polymerase I-like protein with 3'-5' exonuclease and polymerase domains